MSFHVADLAHTLETRGLSLVVSKPPRAKQWRAVVTDRAGVFSCEGRGDTIADAVLCAVAKYDEARKYAGT